MWSLISKFVAAFIALVYVASATIGGGPAAAVSVMIYLLLPLACIFFSEEMGAVANIHSLSMDETPGCLVIAGGWLLLVIAARGDLYLGFWRAAITAEQLALLANSGLRCLTPAA